MKSKEYTANCKAFVVGDPANLGDRVELAAIMMGGYVMSLRLLLHGSGPGIMYVGNLQVRRKVWVTPAFADKHTALAAIIKDAPFHAKARMKKIQTKILNSEAEFEVVKAHAVAKKRPTTVIGIGTSRECKATTMNKIMKPVGGRGRSSCGAADLWGRQTGWRGSIPRRIWGWGYELGCVVCNFTGESEQIHQPHRYADTDAVHRQSVDNRGHCRTVILM